MKITSQKGFEDLSWRTVMEVFNYCHDKFGDVSAEVYEEPVDATNTLTEITIHPLHPLKSMVVYVRHANDWSCANWYMRPYKTLKEIENEDAVYENRKSMGR